MNQTFTIETMNLVKTETNSRARTLACAFTLLLAIFVGVGDAWGQTVVPYTTSGTFTVQPGTRQITIECWGGGGGGGDATNSQTSAGGGGGGVYAKYEEIITKNSLFGKNDVLQIVVATEAAVGVDGKHSSVCFSGDTLAVGHGGIKGETASNEKSASNGGAGGTGYSLSNSTVNTGGNGGNGRRHGNYDGSGGGGGGCAGTTITNSINGGTANSQGSGGSGGTGYGPTDNKGNGATGAYYNNWGNSAHGAGTASLYGGGGGGAARYKSSVKGNGSNGKAGFVRITYTILTVNITLNGNGGTGTGTPFDILYLTEFQADDLINPFTRSGYTFAGWNTQADGNGTTVAAGDECEFTADQTLYAQWTPREYTIAFDASRPTGVTENVTWNTTCFSGYNTTLSTDNTRVFVRNYSDNEHVYGNECVEHADAVTLDGYVITGWYAVPTGGTPVSYNDAITVGTGAGNIDFPADETQRGSITFYAHWREAYYCFLHADGGVMDASCVTSCGLSTTTDGYSFEILETGAMNPGMGGVLPNSGYNSRAGGLYNSTLGRYEDILTGDHYWKSDSVAGSTSAVTGNVNYFCDSAANGQAPKTDRRSVRCIKKL